ncbi:hypothetical protein P170DRAFT_473201 [Aspergillus steynii IBT 23096]|uniref:Uncharacterized protein n=1 Tax=Aspergillus steynii IBT 23096 TaxID=1392250 RepID=A0A2I2GKC4_9EURO|nr:uncharacterized protein P170DRAFT_473201 [Aspergillus steynii IBT 23096]PLB53332.1 hypothetical protein P170DRAFT_473201 [Aspergillus steynii IBT 23096]
MQVLNEDIQGLESQEFNPSKTISDPFFHLVFNSEPQPEIDLSISPDPFWARCGFWPDVNMQLSSTETPTEKGSDSNATTNTNNIDISTALQASEPSTFSFPDDRTLEVPSLKLLTAATKPVLSTSIQRVEFRYHDILGLLAIRIDLDLVQQFIPFSQPPPPPLNTTLDIKSLPPHLQPIPTQRLIPHHPVLDLLPWPGTRDKLIQVFNLPVSLRPRNAQDPMGLVRLVHGMEDVGGEGIRVQGGDPFEPGGGRSGRLCLSGGAGLLRWGFGFGVG